MTRGAALAASLIGLDRPRWWVIALAVFLLRGGVLLALLPIVVLPTVAGLYNALGPLLVGVYFGAPSEAFIRLIALATAAALIWLLAGGLAASWLELALIDAAAAAAGSPGIAARSAALAWPALAIRLLSMAPFVFAIGWGAIQVRDAAYVEVLRPADVTVPIVLRVVARVPEVVGVLLATWLAGETGGGMAVRRLALGVDRSVVAALARGWLQLVLRPWSLLILAATNLAVLVVVGIAAATAGYAWLQLRAAIAFNWGEILGPLIGGAALLAFVAIWLSGLTLVAVVVAWRSVAWTFEAVRHADADLDSRHAGAGPSVQGGLPASTGQ